MVDPDWNPSTLHGDALLVHLKAGSSRPAMALAVPGGQYATKTDVPNAAGWGTTDESSTISTDILNEAYLELQDDDTCAAFDHDYDAATQTCAGTYEKAGACHGDSGGPLIVWDKAGGNPGPQPTQTPTSTPRPTPTPPAPPVITPAPDRVAPQLAHARLARTRLKAKAGTRLSFDLSEAAAVKLTILKQSGRRYKPVASLPLAASAGHTSRRFSTRKLEPGRYRLTLAAVDTAGNAAPLKTLAFTVRR